MRICLRSGQITVLALLLGLLGLTVGLSAASRTLSDLRQVSYVDSGVRAYAAAEAGLQAAIADYVQNNTIRCGATPTSFNLTTNPIDGISTLTYKICNATQNYAYMSALSKDDVFQVTLPAGNPSAIGSVDVVWSDDNAAMEIISVNSSYQVTRRVAKGQGAAIPANTNPAHNATSVSNCFNSTTCNFTGMESCAQGVSIGTSPTPLFIRVKPLGGSAVSNVNVAVCGRSSGNPVAISSQTIVIEATATTTNGTVKRLQAVQNPVALPSMFDNVIFSGGSLQKN